MWEGLRGSVIPGEHNPASDSSPVGRWVAHCLVKVASENQDSSGVGNKTQHCCCCFMGGNRLQDSVKHWLWLVGSVAKVIWGQWQAPEASVPGTRQDVMDPRKGLQGRNPGRGRVLIAGRSLICFDLYDLGQIGESLLGFTRQKKGQVQDIKGLGKDPVGRYHRGLQFCWWTGWDNFISCYYFIRGYRSA